MPKSHRSPNTPSFNRFIDKNVNDKIRKLVTFNSDENDSNDSTSQLAPMEKKHSEIRRGPNSPITIKNNNQNKHKHRHKLFINQLKQKQKQKQRRKIHGVGDLHSKITELNAKWQSSPISKQSVLIDPNEKIDDLNYITFSES